MSKQRAGHAQDQMDEWRYGQVIRGVIGGSTQMQRGRWKVERMPRSEQKWMGEQKWLGDLRGRWKLSGEQTGEQMYQMNVEG